MSLVAAPEIAEAITPEMQALARGLQNEPKQIFDYVHDHIRCVHYFGSKKGAQLTLLERSGNDFDQCALLVALLRAAAQNSGVSCSVQYWFGLVYMPYESWRQGLADTSREDRRQSEKSAGSSLGIRTRGGAVPSFTPSSKAVGVTALTLRNTSPMFSGAYPQ